MDIVDRWTGRTANALQDALRMSHEAFAQHLGVAPRTVAGWHQQPDVVPRPEMQQLLDVAHEQASDAVRRRFAALVQPAAGAQALRVAVAVVVQDGRVLLVCRRDSHSSLRWQFPSGIVKPGADPETVAVQETHAETGVHCAVRRHLGGRLHPVTGALCDYWLADYLSGQATNVDVLENTDVQWAPCSDLPRWIPSGHIYPPVTAALEDT